LQTAYASYIGRFDDDSVQYTRELLNMSDGGIVSLDWSPSPEAVAAGAPTTPLLIVFHGLTGGSHETYVKDVVSRWTSAPVHGHAVVVNSRGCAETELRSPRLYSGGETGDVRVAVAHIRQRRPEAPLVAAGFSLGANFLTKYVGEEKDACVLSGFAAVANPFDLHVSSLFLHSSWIGRNVYSPYMAQSLQRLYQRHKEMIDSNPSVQLSPTAILSAKSLPEFDAALTARAFGFRTVNEYYRRASSAQYVPDISVPALLLSALDDPVASRHAIPYPEVLANPHVLLATTDRGGHIGWFEGVRRIRRWSGRPVVEFLAALASAKKPETAAKA
ncbi:hypothetical protein HK405_013476, partial [Cladochytrium tenue]